MQYVAVRTVTVERLEPVLDYILELIIVVTINFLLIQSCNGSIELKHLNLCQIMLRSNYCCNH